ncbi:hypothetical protein KR222_005282 [Zaprionus bogoriensis]|nr:hypothetical protein KR222_005282 [Zaprionus bogoriensis]
MPFGRKLTNVGSDEARRQRVELRTSYGNKQSNLNLGRLRSRSNAASTATSTATSTAASTATSASLHRIASSFAHVSDVNCGSCAALPHEDSEEDAREERAEVLIRSEPFKAPGFKASPATTSMTTTSTAAAAAAAAAAAVAAARTRAAANANANSNSTTTERRNHFLCADVMQSRASERWNQIACTVSALFRVRRYPHANPLSELRRLREQRDLLEAFTRPFLCEDGAAAERRSML